MRTGHGYSILFYVHAFFYHKIFYTNNCYSIYVQNFRFNNVIFRFSIYIQICLKLNHYSIQNIINFSKQKFIITVTVIQMGQIL